MAKQKPTSSAPHQAGSLGGCHGVHAGRRQSGLRQGLFHHRPHGLDMTAGRPAPAPPRQRGDGSRSGWPPPTRAPRRPSAHHRRGGFVTGRFNAQYDHENFQPKCVQRVLLFEPARIPFSMHPLSWSDGVLESWSFGVSEQKSRTHGSVATGPASVSHFPSVAARCRLARPGRWRLRRSPQLRQAGAARRPRSIQSRSRINGLIARRQRGCSLFSLPFIEGALTRYRWIVSVCRVPGYDGFGHADVR